MFLFPENMIWHLRRKMKDDLSQKKTKKHGNMTFSSNFLKTWSFQKEPRRDMISYYLSHLFPENMIFISLGRKWEMAFLKKYMEI